ncbi:MAG: carbon-nitrogen hydrolase family protein [Firmicutes bacterium]|nr:carbon-nitrogen hydrolase family protein [Bacillota bacterium]
MKLKICGLQPGTFKDGDTKESYLEKHIALLERAVSEEEGKDGKKPYVCVFPEAMTYAYFGVTTDDKWFAYAEDAHTGVTTTRMIKEAARLGVHIVYSFFEKASEFNVTHYYNTVGLVSPTRGLIGIYRKTHIPASEMPVNESYYFEPGNILPVFELDNGVKVGMLICYDRSFPMTWQSLYLQGAQMIFVPACTWGFRGPFFQTELQTRAFETHTFVIGLNRAGEEQVEGEEKPRNHFGKTFIAGPMGEMIDTLADEQWEYVAADVDLDEILEAHKLMNYKRDRRPELYGVVAANGNFAGPYAHRPNKF